MNKYNVCSEHQGADLNDSTTVQEGEHEEASTTLPYDADGGYTVETVAANGEQPITEPTEEEIVEVTVSDHGEEDGVGGKSRKESDQGIGVHQGDDSKQEPEMGQGEVSLSQLDEAIRSSQTGMKLRRSERNRRPPDWYGHSNQILAIQTDNWLRDFDTLWQDFPDRREETYQELLRKCQAKWCDGCGCQENVVSFVLVWCFYRFSSVLIIFYLYFFLCWNHFLYGCQCASH